MKDLELKAIEKLVEFEDKAIDLFIKQYVDPIADVGNPEKVLDKKYEDWTLEDMQKAVSIYGNPPSPLSRLVVRKEYEKVKELESEL